MAVITNIANLSQTPALNGPDGAVDPPSSLDDQDRYLGSFIAKLRDGVGYSAGAAVAALGFTPVRQGTGPSQLANTVSIGWSAAGKLYCSVDGNAFGNVWPIDADAAMALHSGGVNSGPRMTFAWSDDSSVPTYLWGGNDPSAQRVVPPSRLSVSYANSAGSAGSANTANTASNANAVNGISGWNYSNRAKNPAYIWVTDGASTDQFLTQPGNLSVAYANSAGSVNYSNNSGQLGGQNPGFYINNANSAVVNIRNNGALWYVSAIGGYGDVTWQVGGSDQRLKKDVAPTQDDSLAKIEQLNFVRFRFRDDVTQLKIDDGRVHSIGLIAQQAESVDPQWANDGGTFKALNHDSLLLSALHAIKQLNAKVADLSAKLASANW